MLLEEFYRKELKEEEIAEYFYVDTLRMFLRHNDILTFDKVLEHFENTEQYLVCEGIHRAIKKIEEIHSFRFAQAAADYLTKEDEEADPEEMILIDIPEERMQSIKELMVQDLLIEIYERQIKRNQANR